MLNNTFLNDQDDVKIEKLADIDKYMTIENSFIPHKLIKEKNKQLLKKTAQLNLPNIN